MGDSKIFESIARLSAETPMQQFLTFECLFFINVLSHVACGRWLSLPLESFCWLSVATWSKTAWQHPDCSLKPEPFQSASQLLTHSRVSQSELLGLHVSIAEASLSAA